VCKKKRSIIDSDHELPKIPPLLWGLSALRYRRAVQSSCFVSGLVQVRSSLL
jgi:hypothetical protein